MGGPMRFSCTLEVSLGEIADTSGVHLVWPSGTLSIWRSASPVSHRLWDMNLQRLFRSLTVSQQNIHTETLVTETPLSRPEPVAQWCSHSDIRTVWYHADKYIDMLMFTCTWNLKSKQAQKLWFTYVDIDVIIWTFQALSEWLSVIKLWHRWCIQCFQFD